MKNKAVIIVRPQTARSQAAMTAIEDILDDWDVSIAARRHLSGPEIISKGILDRHFGKLAEFAMCGSAAGFRPGRDAKERFCSFFGEEWDSAAASDRIMSAAKAVGALKLDEQKIGEFWAEHGAYEISDDMFVSHFMDDGLDAFVVNGFYHAMRRDFCSENAYALAMLAEFECSWETFNENVAGAENPACADENSIRGYIYDHATVLEMFVDAIDNVILASRSNEEAARHEKLWMR